MELQWLVLMHGCSFGCASVYLIIVIFQENDAASKKAVAWTNDRRFSMKIIDSVNQPRRRNVTDINNMELSAFRQEKNTYFLCMHQPVQQSAGARY